MPMPQTPAQKLDNFYESLSKTFTPKVAPNPASPYTLFKFQGPSFKGPYQGANAAFQKNMAMA